MFRTQISQRNNVQEVQKETVRSDEFYFVLFSHNLLAKMQQTSQRVDIFFCVVLCWLEGCMGTSTSGEMTTHQDEWVPRSLALVLNGHIRGHKREDMIKNEISYW